MTSRAAPEHKTNSSTNCPLYSYTFSERNGEKTCVCVQCCGSGSVLDPYSGASWIRIRIPNMDPDPHMQI